MSREVCIVSVRDGLSLTLSNFVSEDASHISESFLVVVKADDIRHTTYELKLGLLHYMANDLGAFFQSIATEGKGWKGGKLWSALESELELEVGQLDGIAQDVQLAWNAPE